MRRRRSSIILQRAEVQRRCADADLVGALRRRNRGTGCVADEVETVGDQCAAQVGPVRGGVQGDDRIARAHGGPVESVVEDSTAAAAGGIGSHGAVVESDCASRDAAAIRGDSVTRDGAADDVMCAIPADGAPRASRVTGQGAAGQSQRAEVGNATAERAR